MTQIEAFSAAMHVCDPSLEGHASRVRGYAEAVARRLGWGAERVAELRVGATLHDVGKVNVRADVLRKPGSLDAEEMSEIRAHPVEGAWLIAGIRSLAVALPYVLFHHERWDGRGYPTRRSGTDIPIEGRILAVADAFDAMTTDRPYRRALPVDRALDEVRRGSGSQFDPTVAEALIDTVTSGAHLPVLAVGAPG